MKLQPYLAAGVMAMAFLSAAVRADPLDPKRVPADAKWVIHLDMDATRRSQTWDLLAAKIKQEPEQILQGKIDTMSTDLGIKFPDDVHGVTLFGRGFGEQSGAILLDAAMDQAKITAALQANVAFKKISYNSHDILSWFDKDNNKTMYGCFATPSLAVMADSVEQVQAALDVRDGKTASLKPADALATGKGSTILLYLAGDGLEELAKVHPESPMLAQLNSAWVTISQEEGKLVVRAALNAKTSDAAEQIKKMAEGVQSFMAMSGGAEGADHRAKLAAAVMAGLALKTSGQTLDAELPVSMENVASFLNAMPKRGPAGGGPPGAPAHP